jgi:hypothetical protein
MEKKELKMEMETVSYLTLNGDTRRIVDEKGRKDIDLLKAQIEYLANELNVDISNVKPKN